VGEEGLAPLLAAGTGSVRGGLISGWGGGRWRQAERERHRSSEGKVDREPLDGTPGAAHELRTVRRRGEGSAIQS